MKKTTNLIIPAMVLLMAVVFSCAKESTDTPANTPVSGIFKGDTLYLNDSVIATVIFSFDELEEGTINGGVRIRIVGNKQNYRKQKYLSQHEIGLWTKNDNNTTEIAGEADMGDELGVISFSGLITGNDSFDYILTGEGFADDETAAYVGEYIRQDGSKSTTTTNYIGSYAVSCGAASTYSCGQGEYYTCDAFSVTMHVTAQTPGCCGGIDLTGYFSGTIPNLGSSDHVFNTQEGQSEVYGGYLSIETVGSDYFYYGCNDCAWDPTASYGCDYGYAIYWTPPYPPCSLWGLFCLESNISMGAQ